MEIIEKEIEKERRKMLQIEKEGIWGVTSVTIPTFKSKIYIMTTDEHKMYRCLEEIYKNTNVKISIQVALNQILEANTKRYFSKNYKKSIINRFIGISIDFVLFDIKTNKILCCIELNGKEHETDIERIERDKFLRETFELLDIPLIMIKSQEIYKQNEIKEIINFELKE